MSNKSFEAGMIAGAKPFEEKFQKQATSFDKTADRLDSKLDDIKSVTDTLVDDGLTRERKEVFGLNTQFDINNMEDTEKILVVSLLYSLAQRFEANDYQKNYVRSVQKYLGLKNIQPADTLTGVENVKDTDSQKAILQVMMEYLFLDGFSFDFLDEEDYEELFDSFNVNRKGFREVEKAIENIYQAVGAEGLAEKYGSTNEEGQESESDDEKVDLPELLDICVIERDLTIHEGEEIKFTNKELVFEKSIICAGSIVFENCCIRYSEEGKVGHLILEGGGRLTMQNCDVYCNEFRNEAFMTAKANSRIDIHKCLFYQCTAFCSAENITEFSISNCSFMECWTDFITVVGGSSSSFAMENSEFFFNSFTKTLLDIENGLSILDRKAIFLLDCNANISNISATGTYLDTNRHSIKDGVFPTLFKAGKEANVVIRNGRFNGVRSISHHSYASSTLEIRNCMFDDCRGVAASLIDFSIFKSCQRIIHCNLKEMVNCVFSSCSAPLMSGLQKASIKKCTFYNTKIQYPFKFIEFLAWEGRTFTGEVVDCVFDGVRISKKQGYSGHGYLIATDSMHTKKVVPAQVKNCKFYNAVSDTDSTELIKTVTMVDAGLFGTKQKPVELVAVNGCSGDLVAHKGTYSGSNPNIPKTDNNGRPIGVGAKLNTETVGVQLANQGE